MKSSRLFTSAFVAFAAVMTAPEVLAHAGHGGHEHPNSFFSGFIHPLTGLDHLVMLLGLGILIHHFKASTKASANNNLLVKNKLMIASLASLCVGLVAGSFFGAVNGVEWLIMASIFVVALAIWNTFGTHQTMTKNLVVASIALVFFHGFAHGVEATGTLAGFGAGMFIAAAMILMVGERVALFFASIQLFASKWLGAGVAASGAVLMLAS